MNIPPTLAAEQALTQQKVALSAFKQKNEADEALVQIIQESTETVAASSRGSNVDIFA